MSSESFFTIRMICNEVWFMGFSLGMGSAFAEIEMKAAKNR